jgi:hypothetical protein
VTGGVGIGGALNVTGTITGAAGTLTSLTSSGVVNITDSTVSSSATTGALKVTGGVGIGGALNVTGTITGAAGTLASLTSSGVVNITDSTVSSSATTGALKVTGGVGIGGALNVTGTITGAAGTLTGLSLDSSNSNALTTASATNAYDISIRRNTTTNGLSCGIGFLMTSNPLATTPAGGAITFTRVDGPAVGYLSFFTSNLALYERMRIAYNGKIGINTTEPDRQLEINASDGNCLRLTYNDANGSASTYFDQVISSTGSVTFKYYGCYE